jgi:Xaa-Pro aminopeptidase
MLDAPRPDWPGRLQSLRDYCAAHALDALVVSGSANLRYLCGFTGSAGLLVVAAKGDWLVTDGRYETAVTRGLKDGTLAPVTLDRVERRYDLSLAARLIGSGGLGARRVGFEAGQVTVATLRSWGKAAPGVEWVPTDGVVEGRRMIKDPAEIAVLRRGAAALSEVAGAIGTMVAAGRSEIEIARDVDTALERAGFSQPAFPTIVAAGPNSALPHARPSGRRLAKGDLVLLDFGGVLDGYCVDLTRMAALGPVDARAGSIFEAVRDAQRAALSAIRAGVPASDVDGAARRLLEDRGLGPAFLHSTGHGLGLEVHEAPRLARADPDAEGAGERLLSGMVCTVEPGAYVDGLGGVRLEDDVLVTDDGCEVLTSAPRELLVV